MLILVGDNPERIRSEAAFAKLCGVCPVPASSGKTNRIASIGRQPTANAALYRVVIVRMRITSRPRLRQKAQSRWQRQNGNHPLSQAIRGPRDLRLFMRRSTIGAFDFRKHLTDIGHQRRDRNALRFVEVERLHGCTLRTRRQAKDEVIDWLQFYNHRRLHSTLDISADGLREKTARR